jgi:hypothetical protein
MQIGVRRGEEHEERVANADPGMTEDVFQMERVYFCGGQHDQSVLEESIHEK